jgi:spore maturation protein SpmA
MLNYIWAYLLITGLLVAGFVGRISGDGNVMAEAFAAAEKAVMGIALPLAGMMMFWMGALRLLEKAGVLEAVVKVMSPILKKLFPDVPDGHPALGAIVMNWCANMLGLGNAATPLGLKAMGHLQEINPHKQSASNEMVTFLALNTGAFTLIPMTAIIYLNTAGMAEAPRIIMPTILATICATIAAVIASKTFQGFPGFKQQPDETDAKEGADVRSADGMTSWSKALLAVLLIAFVGIAALEFGPQKWRDGLKSAVGVGAVLNQAEARAKESKAQFAAMKEESSKKEAAVSKDSLPVWRRVMDGGSSLAIPAILLIAVGVSLARRVKVYEEFIEGAKEGFQVAVRIMPFLVAMLAMLAVLRASGVFALLEYAMAPLLGFLGFPVELLSLGLMRPLSGSGASGILMEILTRPDLTEQVKYTAAIMYGSTETTFYVVAVYFGSVGIKKIRHALLAGLTADFVGMVAAVVFGKLLF